jgi:tetratricopeptide (TPR) repeat protein
MGRASAERAPRVTRRMTRGRVSGTGPASSYGPAAAAAAALTLALAGVGCWGDAESAVGRGDRFWADSNWTAALAEYRLAAAAREGDPTVLARVAHAYLLAGQFERAREAYDRLMAIDPEWADQAVFDYVTAARRARSRGDRYGMAVAAEAALRLRPGLPLDDMAASLGRYYAAIGEPESALDFFERALTYAPADSVPELLYEIGEVHEARGDCAGAIGFFNAYRSRAPRAPRVDQARWRVGNCSFQLARAARARGEDAVALRHLETMIGLGVPQNLLDQAWFERGEALLALGRHEEALRAYSLVLELGRLRTGQLADRAQQRIDQIRFGRVPELPPGTTEPSVRVNEPAPL